MKKTLVALELSGRYVWSEPVESAAILQGVREVRFDCYFHWTPPHVEITPAASRRLVHSILERLGSTRDVVFFVHGPQGLARPGKDQRVAQNKLRNANPNQIGVTEWLETAPSTAGRPPLSPDWDFKRTAIEFFHALTWGDQNEFRSRDGSPRANVFEVHPRDATWSWIANKVGQRVVTNDVGRQKLLAKAFADHHISIPTPEQLPLNSRQLAAACSLYIGLLHCLYEDEEESYCTSYGEYLTRVDNVWREGFILDLKDVEIG